MKKHVDIGQALPSSDGIVAYMCSVCQLFWEFLKILFFIILKIEQIVQRKGE